MKKLIISLAFCVLVSSSLIARNQILISGSSTVFPFSSKVAEIFGQKSKFKAPNVEATGSGSGIKAFCSGLGEKYPDVANASRAMKSSEFALCKKNGVSQVVEIEIGYDGIVIAQSNKAKKFNVSIKQIFMALAAEVVDKNGKLIKNPNKKWSDIDPGFPSTAISVYGPPPTSGTRDAFISLVMRKGGAEFPALKKMKNFKQLASRLREDGAFIEAGENDNLLVQKLTNNKSALAIFGFSFLEQNASTIRGLDINGIEPTFENIADQSYAIARSMFIYIKKQHADLIPGLKEFVVEFTSESSWGPEGYLSDIGFIPLPNDKRKAQADIAAMMKVKK